MLLVIIAINVHTQHSNPYTARGGNKKQIGLKQRHGLGSRRGCVHTSLGDDGCWKAGLSLSEHMYTAPSINCQLHHGSCVLILYLKTLRIVFGASIRSRDERSKYLATYNVGTTTGAEEGCQETWLEDALGERFDQDLQA